MSWIDVLIPMFCGIVLVTSPRLFIKKENAENESTKTKLRKAGGLLLLVSALYLCIKFMENT